MKDTKKYNGWKNWATWNVSLWFNNDKLLYSWLIRAKSTSELKAIFNSEIDLFKDFNGLNDPEIENIDWKEIFELNKDE